jgi:hypothetical protein
MAEADSAARVPVMRCLRPDNIGRAIGCHVAAAHGNPSFPTFLDDA